MQQYHLALKMLLLSFHYFTCLIGSFISDIRLLALNQDLSAPGSDNSHDQFKEIEHERGSFA